MAKYIVGVDIGGTNTDVVVMCDGKVISFVKESTTQDITTGIVQSIQKLLVKANLQTSDLKCVMIGTTHFVNAVVQRSSEMRKVAVLRLCGPASNGLPPFSDFPADLRDLIYGHYALLSGGLEYDTQEIAPVLRDEIVGVCAQLKEKQLYNIVVSGVFSPLKADQEKEVATIVKEILPEARVTMSHEVGFMGLLERENAAILNASIRPLAEKTIASMRKAMSGINLVAPFYLTQNDGTLIDSESIEKYPVRTFASGVTNSMRGAAFLTGYKDAVVVDIGGTSSDFGALKGGFPRPASTTVEVGEVRTNFPMPDVFSIALGGGSIVDLDNLTVGPKSVGYELVKKSLVFGGSVTTTTDIVVAQYGEQIGDASKISHLDKAKIAKIIEVIEKKIELGIEAIQTSSEDLPVVLVGGGSVLLRDNQKLGGKQLVKPKFHEVANAVGAAIAQVSAAKDTAITWTSEKDREEKVEALKKEAIEEVVARGGVASSALISEIEQIPLSYVPGNVERVKVKAVADLSNTSKPDQAADAPHQTEATPKAAVSEVKSSEGQATANTTTEVGEPKAEKAASAKKDITSYVPTVSGKEWILSEQDIDFIAIGSSILGAGGGGSPYYGSIEAKKLIREGKKIVVIPAQNITPDQTVIPCATVGAPTVLEEKLGSKDQIVRAVRGVENITHKKASAILIAEIGGSNSMYPLITAALAGLPVVDGDLMGRAFPECQMMTTFIYGLPCFPAALADEKGNELVLASLSNFKWLEKMLRVGCVTMGCEAGVAFPPVAGDDLQRVVVPNGLSKSWLIGRAVCDAKQKRQSPVQRIVQQENGKLLFTGKITDLQRKVEGGFNRGVVKLQGLEDFNQRTATVLFQNENLIVKSVKVLPDGTSTEEILAVVPDIISLVDSESGINIHTEQLRYGLRVSVIGIPSHPLLSSETALKVVGPSAFGFGDKYQPLGDYKDSQPIYELFKN